MKNIYRLLAGISFLLAMISPFIYFIIRWFGVELKMDGITFISMGIMIVLISLSKYFEEKSDKLNDLQINKFRSDSHS